MTHIDKRESISIYGDWRRLLAQGVDRWDARQQLAAKYERDYGFIGMAIQKARAMAASPIRKGSGPPRKPRDVDRNWPEEMDSVYAREYLGIGINVLMNYVKSGKLPRVKKGRVYWYRRKDLDTIDALISAGG